MKLSLINKGIIIAGAIVLISGIKLHVGYSALSHDHQMMMLWLFIHVPAACILLGFACLHVSYNKWWFKTLRIKAKNSKTVMQRIFTPLTALSFLALIITGLMMLCGWYPHDSHIWRWHYVIGIVWAVLAVCHGSLFLKRRNVNTKR